MAAGEGDVASSLLGARRMLIKFLSGTSVSWHVRFSESNKKGAVMKRNQERLGKHRQLRIPDLIYRKGFNPSRNLIQLAMTANLRFLIPHCQLSLDDPRQTHPSLR